MRVVAAQQHALAHPPKRRAQGVKMRASASAALERPEVALSDRCAVRPDTEAVPSRLAQQLERHFELHFAEPNTASTSAPRQLFPQRSTAVGVVRRSPARLRRAPLRRSTRRPARSPAPEDDGAAEADAFLRGLEAELVAGSGRRSARSGCALRVSSRC